mgnify:CR=1 FL=1|tara:strand:- start:10492 stop:10626 length:135 start_codon:yes stop_codon:yes gene_type:complete
MGHHRDTAREREHFLEFATLLLAALSLVGVVFNVLPVVVFGDCR